MSLWVDDLISSWVCDSHTLKLVWLVNVFLYLFN